MQAAFDKPGMNSTTTHMCQHNKARPDNGLPVRQSTTVKGTAEVCAAVAMRCPGNHTHSTIQGNMHVPVTNKDGRVVQKTMKVSELVARLVRNATCTARFTSPTLKLKLHPGRYLHFLLPSVIQWRPRSRSVCPLSNDDPLVFAEDNKALVLAAHQDAI